MKQSIKISIFSLVFAPCFVSFSSEKKPNKPDVILIVANYQGFDYVLGHLSGGSGSGWFRKVFTDYSHAGASDYLAEIRQLLFDGKRAVICQTSA